MNWVIKIMGVFWTRRESMSKIYHFICWICCFTKRLKPWISNLGCRAELITTGTELAWDHGENLRDAKGLPNKDGFQLEQEMKGLPRAGYCCDLLPTELQREGHCCGRGRGLLTGCLGAAAALWYLQKLGSRVLEQEKSPVTIVSGDRRQVCSPSPSLCLGSPSAILCQMVVNTGGFQDSCPCNRTQPTSGHCSNTQSAAQPQIVFLYTAFYITLSSL